MAKRLPGCSLAGISPFRRGLAGSTLRGHAGALCGSVPKDLAATRIPEEEPMLSDFKKFLLQTNALALAVGVIIGAAIGKVVSSLAGDILMPIIGLAIPGGAWRESKIILSTKPDGSVANAITYGSFLGNIVDFVIIAFVVFMITKALLRPSGPAPAPLKACPFCLEEIPKAASKCRACASAV
jgi:large conductance mechanosensitive channel